ncbi:hypothetical protein [Bowmanella dokdonensis]|uniref:hypothetical protein n=1 Tax=Bowmanella dokdonensis TaxID=751969 RepID=UPI001F49DFBD|nr:hypothetical protein [Bowmanella dokdonensis]
MFWTKWLPWRFVLTYVARSHGFLDPVALLSRLHRFAQPSEVGEPVELLRAGVVFHARGLINSRVIQHNLDWVWPYWVQRQFDPADQAFIPRAFSITHVNLTHRNWTAVGLPDCEELPIVDPRGLLTPFLDGWSLDGWIKPDKGDPLYPSQCKSAFQQWQLEEDVRVATTTEKEGLRLTQVAWVEWQEGIPVCILELTADATQNAKLVLSLRPQNPEGVSFIHQIDLNRQRDGWTVDEDKRVDFSEPAERHVASEYHGGDVALHLDDKAEQQSVQCDVGMATAAALFDVKAGQTRKIRASIPLSRHRYSLTPNNQWQTLRQEQSRLQCPEEKYCQLYEGALTSLLLHSPGDVYPGPYTYKRFWFRDAAFILHAMLSAGLARRVERTLDKFPERQTRSGYFRSQEGEWDANGEVLWILQRYSQLTGKPVKSQWRKAIREGADWIIHKRLPDKGGKPHAGLLPPGFSAEHLGPNDYYYWDDFWGIAGLNAAAGLLADEQPQLAEKYRLAAQEFEQAVSRSLEHCQKRLNRPAMPASPYRRLDAGAIGSLACGYPLELYEKDDPRLLDTVAFLLDKCFVQTLFFQDMIHSGLNAYLTLHAAQVMLRAGDKRFQTLMDAVANLATPTGQWPEAVHPQTGGGCMGDGHHVWAAAEWVLMQHQCFVREEGEGLVLCSGIPERWLGHQEPISLGPVHTKHGSIKVEIIPRGSDRVEVSWQANWHHKEPPVEVRLPGFVISRAKPGTECLELERESG